MLVYSIALLENCSNVKLKRKTKFSSLINFDVCPICCPADVKMVLGFTPRVLKHLWYFSHSCSWLTFKNCPASTIFFTNLQRKKPKRINSGLWETRQQAHFCLPNHLKFWCRYYCLGNIDHNFLKIYFQSETTLLLLYLTFIISIIMQYSYCRL